MADRDWMQISVNGKPVGVMGLKKAMEDLSSVSNGMSQEEIGSRLLKTLEEKNYIPQRARDAYAGAVVREYKKYLGLPVEDDVETGVIRVAVLGPGCFNCSKLEQDVREVMAEMKIAGDLSHITDGEEISRYRIIGVPALAINGSVVCAGMVPDRNKIREWLIEAVSSAGKDHNYGD